MKAGQIETCDGVTIFGYNSGAVAPFVDNKARQTIFNQTHSRTFEEFLESSNSAILHYSGHSNGNYRTRVRVKTDQSVYGRQFRQHCPLCAQLLDEV